LDKEHILAEGNNIRRGRRRRKMEEEKKVSFMNPQEKISFTVVERKWDGKIAYLESFLVENYELGSSWTVHYSLWRAGRRENDFDIYSSKEELVGSLDCHPGGWRGVTKYFHEDLSALNGKEIWWDEKAPHQITIGLGGEIVIINPEGLKAEKASKKAFAVEQAAKLLEMGFNEKQAWRIIRAAGPGRAIQAAEWTVDTLAGALWGSSQCDGLLAVIEGTIQSRAGCVRRLEALESLGFVVDSKGPVGSATGLKKLLRGIRATLLSIPA
jgi:hypothetical protein